MDKTQFIQFPYAGSGKLEDCYEKPLAADSLLAKVLNRIFWQDLGDEASHHPYWGFIIYITDDMELVIQAVYDQIYSETYGFEYVYDEIVIDLASSIAHGYSDQYKLCAGLFQQLTAEHHLVDS